MQHRLLLINGASSSGKSTVMESLTTKAGFRPAPKYTTRALRPYEASPLRHITDDTLPTVCDVQYFFAGNRYGVSSIEIQSALEESDLAVIIASNDALATLKHRFQNTKAVWVHREFDEKRVRRDLWRKGLSGEAVEWCLNHARAAEAEFVRHAPLFDIVILNNGDLESLERLIGGALVSFEAGASREALYESPGKAVLTPTSEIVVVSRWLEKQLLARHPERLFELAPREFEELVASILADEGYEVELTPQTRDGGFDILAIRRDLAVPYLCLVECKRYSQSRPVGVQVVRQLVGIASQKRASAALLVTTSCFTRSAEEFRQEFAYQVGFRDFKAVVDSLSRYRL
jgi:guanylate kinase